MLTDLQELSASLGAAPDLDTFWRLAHGALSARGVQSIFYGAMASSREADHLRITKSLIWKTSHPREFLDAFEDNRLLDDDYTVQHCLTKSSVMLWHEEASWRDASPRQQARARIENELGFNVGFTVPASHFSRGQVGGIGVAMPDVGKREFSGFWNERSRDILAICGMLDIGMRRHHIGEVVCLSPREKECLTWLAVGMRPDQIASRLSIGGKSVEKYIASAKVKLKAATRDHAVAKAILFNLITP